MHSIAELPDSYFKIPPLAKACTLAYIKGPIERADASSSSSSSSFKSMANRYLADLVWDKVPSSPSSSLLLLLLSSSPSSIGYQYENCLEGQC